MADDPTNDEVIKGLEKSQKEFDDADICPGVSYIDNHKQFVVEQIAGRVLIINPEKQDVSKSMLCRLQEMGGLNYVQSTVSKTEQRSSITHNRVANSEMNSLSAIITKHDVRWMDKYENEYSGTNEVIGEKNLSIESYKVIHFEDNVNFDTDHMVKMDGAKKGLTLNSQGSSFIIDIRNLDDLTINVMAEKLVRLIKIGTNVNLIVNGLFAVPMGTIPP